MSCIPMKTLVKNKKKVFTFSHVLYSSAGSENPGEDGVIFQGVFNSPTENLVKNSPPVGNKGFKERLIQVFVSNFSFQI